MNTKTTGRVAGVALAAAGALAAVALVAGPAAADDAYTALDAAGSLTASGQVTLTGTYMCDPAVAQYAELEVSADQSPWNGEEASATVYDRVACTGDVQSWSETLTAPEASASFTPGPVSVQASVWSAGDSGDGAQSWQQIYVS